jgi:hypothetical protein
MNEVPVLARLKLSQSVIAGIGVLWPVRARVAATCPEVAGSLRTSAMTWLVESELDRR